MNKSGVTAQNQEFWNELCGSQLAKAIGVKDSSVESLKKFDDWYFNFYPYLFDHIPFSELNNKDVLEIGLGYGTVAQRLVESGAKYQGLDIAEGPVNMVNHRITRTGGGGEALQGSVLDLPFDRQSFDTIVTIGCLHHTGNLQMAIDQCWEMLRPGGELIFMVYYAYSYRRFRMAPIITSKYIIRELMGSRGVVGISGKNERAAYDVNSEGHGAPHTDWVSIRSLREMCKRFSTFNAKIENIDEEWPFSRTSREKLLKSQWPEWVGLDLYVTVTK